MEVFINERLVKQRALLGKVAFWAGLVVLVGGLAASFKPEYFFLSIIALVLGFVFSQIGSYNLLRWARSPRPDEVLTRSLKGLDNKYRFYHHFTPASHVLVGPTGLYVFVVKPHSGQVRCSGTLWKHKLSVGRALLIFGQEYLGNPTNELQVEQKKLAQFLAQHQADSQIMIHGAVVFSSPQVQLTLERPSVPVLQPKQIKEYVRVVRKDEPRLSAENRRAVEAILDQAVQDAQTPKKK